MEKDYIDLEMPVKGIGSACIDYIEQWLSSNWKDVTKLIVNTVIPYYNRSSLSERHSNLRVNLIFYDTTFTSFSSVSDVENL